MISNIIFGAKLPAECKCHLDTRKLSCTPDYPLFLGSPGTLSTENGVR